MKPVSFRYERPETVEEAVALLAEHGDEAKVLAGGQSLVPALNMRLARPAVLVDVNRVSRLDRFAEKNGALGIGATVRQADTRLLVHPLLAEAVPFVGHYVTRNRGTVCGSVAHADPAAELALCLTLLGGSVRAASSRGTRDIAADNFFSSHFQTALEPDELVVETTWPAAGSGTGYAFDEFAQRRGDFALAMAGAVVEGGDVRVAVGSVLERATLVDVELARPGESAAAQIEPWGNLHASPDYLRQLVRVLVDRVVARARERAA